jgi:hypothetical protein
MNRLMLPAVIVAIGLGLSACCTGSMERVVSATQDRLDTELRSQDIESWFDRYQAYSAKLLDDSAGTNSYRDKTGNCRLAWFDGLMRDQRSSSLKSEQFSRELHAAALGTKGVFTGLTRQGLVKIDMPPAARDDRFPGSGLDFFTNSLARLGQGREKAFSPFAPSDRAGFLLLLEEQTLGKSNKLGHRFSGPEAGRAASDGLEKLDRAGLASATMQAARLADYWKEGGLDPWLDSLKERKTAETVSGAEGALSAVWITPWGLVVVGGTGPNVYKLDANSAIAAVIDLGGNDRYEEGTVGEGRPVLILLDRSGDDVYAGKKAGIQGGAIGGISVLLEGAGNDRYEALDLAQGACLAGAGLLADAGGNDAYFGERRVQGQGTGGLGLLWDGGGTDTYHAAMLGQGVGGPLGFGLLDDLAGNDAYYAGGKYSGGYDDSPGFGGWSQGVGVGPRGSANGGVGILLDGGGDDLYEYDYFSHGGGYWFAVGIARDFGGNDSRIGSTRANWDGTPRTEKPFVRYGPAYGCHFAMGFLFDDAGDDLYTGTAAGVGFSWDIAVGALFDAAGNDRYVGGNGGFSSQTSFSILADGAGDDRYAQSKPGWATPVSEYHPTVSNKSNFAITYDMGGADTWTCGLTNGTQRSQGWAGGILIDR